MIYNTIYMIYNMTILTTIIMIVIRYAYVIEIRQMNPCQNTKTPEWVIEHCPNSTNRSFDC